MVWFDKIIAKIKWCSFFTYSVYIAFTFVVKW